ncbi:MAG: energy transducer TonB [Leptospirales bacterium]
MKKVQNKFLKKVIEIAKIIVSYLNERYNKRPYTFSFVASLLVITFTLFFSPYRGLHTPDDIIDIFELINVDKISLPKRKVKKDIDPDSQTENEDPDVERAEGQIDDALDLSFYPDIIPPRPIGALKKIYPESARQMDVEAVVFVSVAISQSGKVLAVKVLVVKLSKSLPPELEKSLKADFTRDAIAILSQVRFTSTLYEGKKISVIKEFPFQFKLK